jgi:hypothetical protein
MQPDSDNTFVYSVHFPSSALSSSARLTHRSHQTSAMDDFIFQFLYSSGTMMDLFHLSWLIVFRKGGINVKMVKFIY